MNPKKYFSGNSDKADRRYSLDRMVLYYREAGHSKATARSLAKKYLRFGKAQ